MVSLLRGFAGSIHASNTDFYCLFKPTEPHGGTIALVWATLVDKCPTDSVHHEPC